MGLLLLVLACSSSTDPKPGINAISFLPGLESLQVSLGDTVDFQVLTETTDPLFIQWSADDEIAGTGIILAYFPTTVGIHQVSVIVSVGDEEFTRTWALEVFASTENLPGNVPYLTVNHGLGIGDLVLTFPRLIPEYQPILQYVITYSLTGPIAPEGWNDAEFIVNIPEDMDLDRHIFELGSNVDFPIDAMVWFAIIAVDILGQQSSFPTNGFIVPSYPWTINGVIKDDAGQPLHNVIVDFGCNTCRVHTNQEGEFSVGPFSSSDNINLYTVTNDIPEEGSGFFDAFYDVYLTGIEPAEDVFFEIQLISRYGIDARCSEDIYDGDFLNYFMEMTNTRRPTSGRPDRRLYKWEHYPVSVFIPEHINEHGLDMAALSFAGMELWNTIMGEDYFVRVDNIESAGIFFTFNHEIGGVQGRASMIEPNSYIGDVIPELIEVYIKDTNSSSQWIQEIAMHELCHAIGCADHALCNSPGYLMYIEAGGVLDGDELDAIHIDEQRLMRAIRYLPMGYDLSFVEP